MRFNRMRRRQFITLLAGTAAWPLTASAQQPGEKVRRIGFLGAATSSVAGPWLSALTQRLGELGWVEGRNLQIAVGWAEGRNDRAAEIAHELATANVELIVTYATGVTLAVKRATATIPIVFALAADPVGSGLVACRRAKLTISSTGSRRSVAQGHVLESRLGSGIQPQAAHSPGRKEFNFFNDQKESKARCGRRSF